MESADDAFRVAGVIDFAGSGVVHWWDDRLIAAIIRPRKAASTTKMATPLEEPPFLSAPQCCLQILVPSSFGLMVGRFNLSVQLCHQHAGIAGVASSRAVTTTMAAAAAGCVTAMFTVTSLLKA
jgi:hypothetical protein